jgi:hypothetical protein
MNQLLKTLAEDTAIATGAFARSTVVPIDNEPPPRLIVELPLPGPLAQGVVFIPYRVENLRILPVAGPAARNVSPRVGHLHITVDDLGVFGGWWEADCTKPPPSPSSSADGCRLRSDWELARAC